MAFESNSLIASILRATSPGLAAADDVVLQSGQASERRRDTATRDARHLRLQATVSVDGVLACIPADYLSVLREPLMGVVHTAAKLVSARSTLEKWTVAQATGTIPPVFTTKAPSVQLTKEFAGTDTALQHQEQLKLNAKKLSLEALSEGIRAKTDEVQFLEDSLGAEKLLKDILPTLKARYNDLSSRNQIPTLTDHSNGTVTLDGWIVSPVVKTLYKAVRDDYIVWCQRLIAIVESRQDFKTSKQKQKRKLQEAADVEMADATKPGPSIQSMIDKAINARMKKTGSNQKVRTLFIGRNPTNKQYADFTTQEVEWNQKETREAGELLYSTSPWQVSNIAFSDFQDETGYFNESAQKIATSSAEKREEEEQWEQKGQVESVQEMSKYIYGRPSTIPDWLLSVPLPMAVNTLILNTPVNIVLAAQFKSSVHLSPGVVLPIEIAQDLSLGAKYLLHRPTKPALILAAWNDFKRRIKWRLKFSFEQGDDPHYDPDYDVRRQVDDKKRAPLLPLYLELGLRRGERFVRSTIAHIPTEKPSGTLNSFCPKTDRIQRYLEEHNYIVTSTDKNLGLAVSERTWYIENTLKLLNDRKNYIPVHPLDVQRILDKQFTDIVIAAEKADICFWLGTNLPDFLRSKLPKPGERPALPQFYMIPKIHKNPVGARPIVPCHSAIQNPCAKFIIPFYKQS